MCIRDRCYTGCFKFQLKGYGSRLNAPKQEAPIKDFFPRANECEVVAANKVVRSSLYICGNGDVVPRFRVLRDDYIANLKVKALDLLRRGSRCHQVHILSLIHI